MNNKKRAIIKYSILFSFMPVVIVMAIIPNYYDSLILGLYLLTSSIISKTMRLPVFGSETSFFDMNEDRFDFSNSLVNGFVLLIGILLIAYSVYGFFTEL